VKDVKHWIQPHQITFRDFIFERTSYTIQKLTATESKNFFGLTDGSLFNENEYRVNNE
jgi:hypothetical protein